MSTDSKKYYIRGLNYGLLQLSECIRVNSHHITLNGLSGIHYMAGLFTVSSWQMAEQGGPACPLLCSARAMPWHRLGAILMSMDRGTFKYK